MALGRNTANDNGHFSIGFTGFAQMGLQTLFSRQHDEFYLTDNSKSITESNNPSGCLYNNQRLLSQQATKIINNSTVILDLLA